MANLFLSENFLKGIEIGRRLAVRMIEKEPVAYLYGEDRFRLPILPPAWNREEYPFAYIVYWPSYGEYTLYMHDKCPIAYTLHTEENGDWLTIGSPEKCKVMFWATVKLNYTTGWDERTSPLISRDEHKGTSLIPSEKVIWTNTDIFNEDGSLYLAKSEPIPVYE